MVSRDVELELLILDASAPSILKNIECVIIGYLSLKKLGCKFSFRKKTHLSVFGAAISVKGLAACHNLWVFTICFGSSAN